MIVAVFLLFVFKKKTSYEMRISDWSSDVCSADLIAEIAGECGDALAGNALQAVGDGLEGDAPGHRLEPAGAVAQVGAIEPLARQPVAGMARLVVDPLLVDATVEARQHAQHLAPAGVAADAGADGVEHVDRVGLAELAGQIGRDHV